MMDIASHSATEFIFNIATEEPKHKGIFFDRSRDRQVMMAESIGSALLVAWSPEGFWVGHLWEIPGFYDPETDDQSSPEIFEDVVNFVIGLDPDVGIGDPITMQRGGEYVMKNAHVMVISVGTSTEVHQGTRQGRGAGLPLYHNRLNIVRSKAIEAIGGTGAPGFTYQRPRFLKGEFLKCANTAFEVSEDGHFRILVEDERGTHKVLDTNLAGAPTTTNTAGSAPEAV